MEGRKMVTSLQKVGSRWLMVVEPNSNAIAQRFIVESCADSPETLSKFWREGWSVQTGIGEGNTWIVIGTQWKSTAEPAPQSCSVDTVESAAPAVEKEWNRNRRVTGLIYNRSAWILLNETVQGDILLGQQLIRTTHWPGDEIQQIWAQKRRIQLIYGGPQDWTIVSEQLRHSAPSQTVLAGPDPSQFDFSTQLSSGYKLIGATFQSSTNVYALLWEESSFDSLGGALNQEIYFDTSFPTQRLSALGYHVENNL